MKKLKLGTKFSLLLTIAFVAALLLSGIVLSQTIQRRAEADITTRAEILARTINSVREYTSQNIQPLLAAKLTTEPQFIRETVPAFSAREVFNRFRDRPEYSDFFYKEAAPNPTNPSDRADEFEAELVEKFRSQPELTKLDGYRQKDGKWLFFVTRPLTLNRPSCLECHSSPKLAPRSMIATYGTTGGFGWKLNQVIAAQTIYVPVDEVITQSQKYLVLVMGIFVAIFVPVMWLLNRWLKHMVIWPIKQLTKMTRKVGAGNLATEQINVFDSRKILKVTRRDDESGELARAFQHMAYEVATREENLSQAVEHRTAQLMAAMQEAEFAKSKAEVANQTKSLFLSNMSHELRTPMNAILGFTQLMVRQGSLNPQQQGYLDTISRSGEHLLKLIDDVLEMSKIEAGKTTLNENIFDLYGLLKWLQQLLILKSESKGLELIIEQTSDLPHYIYTDESKLRQVLVNLLNNAIKFTHTGRVTLRAQKLPQTSPPRLQFEVEDTGVGIAPSELERLFQPFVQTEAGRQSQEGTGLGLAISRKFVELMQGEITVSSTLGRGTIFKFQIQVKMGEGEAIATPALNQQVIGLENPDRTYRILIAEDKPENRQLLVELLTPVGFDVREATNGQEAIALCENWSPHLIWMDLRMPVVNGYEAAKRIKSTIAQAPVIIALTGSAFEEDRLIALQNGCDDFVRKPFPTEIIFTKMAEYLGIRYIYTQERGITGDNGVSFQAFQNPVNSVTVPHLTASDFEGMPVDWVKEVYKAANQVNSKSIIHLIAQIPPSYAHLAAPLTRLVNDFDFEEIVRLTNSDSSATY
ncbi:c-type heme family protein [Merismopedia glauca]|uniref:Circadian input-output histidine kinase CikA n=1 Tax=Merismopedia glauca CCAP 1448/3 TaxID=1296344 RepID=A0A2T1C6W2_9CYAN|nr:DUF3365 domain-containing protein [Merismopedia glauca]PSB04015.1 histidine kinase [Merismopedia glauca CCAP 1448/3]